MPNINKVKYCLLLFGYGKCSKFSLFSSMQCDIEALGESPWIIGCGARVAVKTTRKHEVNRVTLIFLSRSSSSLFLLLLFSSSLTPLLKELSHRFRIICAPLYVIGWIQATSIRNHPQECASFRMHLYRHGNDSGHRWGQRKKYSVFQSHRTVSPIAGVH